MDTVRLGIVGLGNMGRTDRDCTLKCLAKGSPLGFVEAGTRRFFQLDDYEKPRPFAGQSVRLTGRVEGDTIFVESVEPAS